MSPDGRHRLSWRILRRVSTMGKNTLALVGFGTMVSLALEYKVDRDLGNKDNELASGELVAGETKQRVLVIPFHRMKVVEKKKKSLDAMKLAKALSSNQQDGSGDEKIIEVT